ncbi:membrane protein insertion efficiency factor YidD [Gluconacetobacter tumulicola]|uniref:Putative membrane protein insertion efficiency factor n=1 Tax=Gluconacetobacter tumulicola TaxID=1017177 RepID=A0A7W4P691_9PROT|nr:membrane protein insertion efficiency factor YidD [Gluconacetobacter tumulicola]MBB2178887.1 membrane protein insertion efficiency factor YidD [Gluconacetobacter tumulicola]
MIRRLRTATVWALVGAIRVYQRFVSPFLGSNCRFVPTCSDYAQEAIRRHGPLRGAFLAGWRILRCNPWNIGGYDPVPTREHARASCCSSHR